MARPGMDGSVEPMVLTGDVLVVHWHNCNYSGGGGAFEFGRSLLGPRITQVPVGGGYGRFYRRKGGRALVCGCWCYVVLCFTQPRNVQLCPIEMLNQECRYVHPKGLSNAVWEVMVRTRAMLISVCDRGLAAS